VQRLFGGAPCGSSLINVPVMAGLVPAIHVLRQGKKDVDARHKAGHDDGMVSGRAANSAPRFTDPVGFAREKHRFRS
jgi:hypothetical protein